MDEQQLKYVISTLGKDASSRYKGSILIDEDLPHLEQGDFCILNTVTKEQFYSWPKPIGHWILLIKDKKKTFMSTSTDEDSSFCYFNSLGQMPTNSTLLNALVNEKSTIYYNSICVQAPGSDLCGFFCCYFLHFYLHELQADLILTTKFDSLEKNDSVVANYFQYLTE